MGDGIGARGAQGSGHRAAATPAQTVALSVVVMGRAMLRGRIGRRRVTATTLSDAHETSGAIGRHGHRAPRLCERGANLMRLWSLHPQYLDPKGLVALWREALLAQAVLRGVTKGYRLAPLELAPFPLRVQTSADLDAARWGLLAWEDPAVALAASPFWVDRQMPRGRFMETDDADPLPILAQLDETGARLSGLRLLDGVLVLRIARGRKAGQVRLVDAQADDAARCGLTVTVVFDRKFPENRARAGAVCSVVWP